MKIHATTLVCFIVGFLWVSDAAMQPDYAAQIRQTEAFMTQLAHARVLGGALLVSKAGKVVLSKGYGWSSEVSTPCVPLCWCESPHTGAAELFWRWLTGAGSSHERHNHIPPGIQHEVRLPLPQIPCAGQQADGAMISCARHCDAGCSLLWQFTSCRSGAC